jgi:hypothetical protein
MVVAEWLMQGQASPWTDLFFKLTYYKASLFSLQIPLLVVLQLYKISIMLLIEVSVYNKYEGDYK